MRAELQFNMNILSTNKTKDPKALSYRQWDSETRDGVI